MYVFFFKQKTSYELRISDLSSDVCSSDLFQAAYKLACHKHSPEVFDVASRLLQREVNRVSCGEFNVCDDMLTCFCTSRTKHAFCHSEQIGRASCRERVCQYV